MVMSRGLNTGQPKEAAEGVWVRVADIPGPYRHTISGRYCASLFHLTCASRFSSRFAEWLVQLGAIPRSGSLLRCSGSILMFDPLRNDPSKCGIPLSRGLSSYQHIMAAAPDLLTVPPSPMSRPPDIIGPAHVITMAVGPITPVIRSVSRMCAVITVILVASG